MRRRFRSSILSIAPLFLFGCGSSDSTPTPDGAAALDGVWDITSNARGGPAEMTISGGVLTGYMVDSRENQPGFAGYADCVATKDRTEFSGTVSGNTGTGTSTEITQATGSGCPDNLRDRKDTQSLAGIRAQTAANWDGDWTITGKGEEWNATVSGLSATATSKQDNKMTIAVVGDILTITSSQNGQSFAARRRR